VVGDKFGHCGGAYTTFGLLDAASLVAALNKVAPTDLGVHGGVDNQATGVVLDLGYPLPGSPRPVEGHPPSLRGVQGPCAS
jgi:hypothetical protein